MAKVLKKDDIELKHFVSSDAGMLFQLIDKNRAHIGEWLWWVSGTTSVTQIEEKIKAWAEKENKGENAAFGIWYKDALAGVISFDSIVKEYKNAEIGYWLDEGHQGKGIVTESCKLLIDYGFKELGLHRIEIRCTVGNEKSCAIPERLGFTKEGLARESGLLNGKFVDHIWYSLLVDEWQDEEAR
ncbi:MAG: GNAT family N-acetyltransferase [Candidatus Levybacteria bacterium]|nr:GNAT family N-acetyltransferase [Candidatus Levybacteria bacterium]